MVQIVDNVENRVRSLGENEVSTTLIGEYVMEDLVNLDEIAYIRFASVYRQFKDMSVFLKELQDIVDKAKSSSLTQKIKRRSFFERKSAKNPTKKYFSSGY